MRYPPALLDEIRARLRVSDIVGRKVRLKRQGREMAGLSPFKDERTPSFFVNDQKGFYHCFASGEHGDIFTFLMKTDGLSFPEAVERLASEAGVALPKPSPEVERIEDERTRLRAACQAAAQFFTEHVRKPVGAAARAYLARRGVDDRLIARFGLGYAPEGRSSLKQALIAQGFSVEEQIKAGLLIGGDDIPVPYDRFRNRVMFPITDLKGRVVAFGGRALEADQKPKYLNSPETPLFHKGAQVFNLAQAREAAHASGQLVVVEGYMDVISLAAVGLDATVAPLGTALTAEQLALLWRVVPEPIICFDGDSAGQLAAGRAIATALPHVRPEASLRFATLPAGVDPDDLVRAQGRPALDAVLADAKPLFDVLWQREWEASPRDTPEARAGLEARLKTLVATITDPDVRRHYQAMLRDRLYEATRSNRGTPSAARGPGLQRSPSMAGAYWRRAAEHMPGVSRGSGRGAVGRGQPRASHGPLGRGKAESRTTALLASGLVRGQDDGTWVREAAVLALILQDPSVLAHRSEALAELEFAHNPLAQLRDAILAAQAKALDVSPDASEAALDSEALRTHFTSSEMAGVCDMVLAQLRDRGHLAFSGTADDGTNLSDRVAMFDHLVALQRDGAVQLREVAAAAAAYAANLSEKAFEVLREAIVERETCAVLGGLSSGGGPQDEMRHVEGGRGDG